MTDTDWPEIYFIRHGQTQWNAERRYQGQRDIPLNELGRRQADANGPLLRDLLERDGRDPAEFQWLASPLGRAVETMERVRAAFTGNLPPVRIEDRLKEISFGALEGKLLDELVKEMVIAPGLRTADYWHYRPEDGESYDDLAVRIHSMHADIAGPSIIVAHGGIARVLRYLVERAPLDEIVNWPPPQDAVMHFNKGSMTLHSSGLASEGPQA
jgi:probable phosphoglycerate mutase